MKKELIKLLELNGYNEYEPESDVFIKETGIKDESLYITIDNDSIDISNTHDSIILKFHYFTLPLGAEFESIKTILQIFKFI